MRLDRLRVEGFLERHGISSRTKSPDRPVTVTVTLARGRSETFPGKIVFVNPLVEADGEFRVRAEVQNRKRERRTGCSARA